MCISSSCYRCDCVWIFLVYLTPVLLFLSSSRKMSALRKSEYLLKLEKESSEVAMRYKEKIRVISCIDPFELASEEMDTNISSFPSVTSWDIFNYLLLTHSFYTAEQMKVHKSLSGYKYFEAGFVHNLGAKKIGENVAVVGKVKHSQRMNELPLNVWVICALDGAIISAHCICMAGLSEVCILICRNEVPDSNNLFETIWFHLNYLTVRYST